jgi:YgiT-type zinc finger domain-containing protein
MNRCHACGATGFRTETVSQIFQIDGKTVMVENIPARVCTRCGGPTFIRENTEKIRRMLHSEAKPIRTVRMDVFTYA